MRKRTSTSYPFRSPWGPIRGLISPNHLAFSPLRHSDNKADNKVLQVCVRMCGTCAKNTHIKHQYASLTTNQDTARTETMQRLSESWLYISNERNKRLSYILTRDYTAGCYKKILCREYEWQARIHTYTHPHKHADGSKTRQYIYREEYSRIKRTSEITVWLTPNHRSVTILIFPQIRTTKCWKDYCYLQAKLNFSSTSFLPSFISISNSSNLPHLEVKQTPYHGTNYSITWGACERSGQSL